MKLYLVTGTDGNGENTDLFVCADDHIEAVGYWAVYYRDNGVSRPSHVFEVPMNVMRGAVPWKIVHDCL